MKLLLRVAFILSWMFTQAYSSEMETALVLFEPRSELFCASYYSSWTKRLKLPNKPSSLVGLQWLKESPNCDWEGYEATSLTGRIALTNMDKCSILQKAVISQKANATSLIVINNGSFPSINDVNLSLEIGIFIMEKGLLDNVQIGYSKAVVFAPQFGYNAGVAVLWVIAVAVVAVGAVWAQHPYKRELRTGYSRKWLFLQYLWPLIIVSTTAGLLLLLYFFYDIAVWFVISFYCLASLVGLYQIFSLFSRFQCLQCRLPEKDFPVLRRRPTVVSAVSLVIAFNIVTTWLVLYIKRPEQYSLLWSLEDILGIAIILSLIREIRIKSFKNHKSVMEQVATGGKVNGGEHKQTLPLLIRVPQITTDDWSVCNNTHGLMLGFGDIAIPGLLVSYCLAFDHTVNIKQSWRGYYISSLLAYGASLLIAIVVSTMTNDAQPALIYLVPGTLLMVVVVGWRRGELVQLLKGINMSVFDSAPVTREGENPFRAEQMTSSDDEEVDFDKAELIRTSTV